MEIKKTLPLVFSELLKTYIDKEICICCLEGQMNFFGKLLKVRKNSIILLEKDKSKYSIAIENIYCFQPTLAYSLHPETQFTQPNTILSQDLHRYLGKNVILRQKCGNVCSTEGIIKYIGEDYIVILNHYNKALNYLYADEELQIFTFE